MIAMVVTVMLLLFATAVAQEEACPYNNRGWSIEHWPMNTDQSEKCQSCTTFFRQEQAIWCNDTSVKSPLQIISMCINKYAINLIARIFIFILYIYYILFDIIMIYTLNIIYYES